MHVQVEDPPVLEPLATLTEDYGHAVLHLAWDLHARTKERTLLFAFVELLPLEIPPPIDDYDPMSGHRLTSASEHRVFVRHLPVTAERGVKWYLACRRGIAIVPETDGRLRTEDDPDAKRFVLARTGEDPPWPKLVTWSPERSVLPFCPHWVESPRLHSLVPLAPFGLDALWPTPSERESAADRLHDLLHFDLREHPELWGSAHLLAPNPVYRGMDVQRRYGVPPAESALVRFQPRAGKRVDGLELIVQERRPWGPADVRRVTVQSPLLELRYPSKIHERRTEVWDPLRGTLESPDSLGIFIDALHINVGVVERTTVTGQAREDRYEVDRAQYQKSTVRDAEPSAESAYAPLRQAPFGNRSRRAAERAGQRWFHGEKQEAHDYVRSLLLEARREVWIVDPYFGTPELIAFLPAVADTTVPIHVLTSAERLRGREDLAPMTGDRFPHAAQEEASDLFAVRLPQLREELRNPIHVRVMTGRRPDVHDRFLVIDDRVFSIGSSLNELGERGTMILAVPHPEPIRELLREACKGAQEFEPWYEARKASRTGSMLDEDTHEAAE